MDETTARRLLSEIDEPTEPTLQELQQTAIESVETVLSDAGFPLREEVSRRLSYTFYYDWETDDPDIVLLFTMFIGGSAGSTGGGVKVVRWIIAAKAIRRELFTTAHPDVVQPVRLGGNVVDEDAIRGIMAFTLLYIVLFAFSAVFIALDTTRAGIQLSVLESISASLATIGNIGPGFGRLGPFGSYLFFPDSSKLLMIFLMWIGRLEIVPVLAVFISRIDGR